MRIKLEAENAFINRLIELSSNDWIHWSGQGKKTGFETLPFDDDMQKKFTTYDWTQGSRKQTYVFRFKAGSSDYRIIGIKENSDPTLYKYKKASPMIRRGLKYKGTHRENLQNPVRFRKIIRYWYSGCSPL